MGWFPPPLFLNCTTWPSRTSCLPLPPNFTFLVLIGSPILLPLDLLYPSRRVDLLVPPIGKKEGQTSLCLLQFSWHYCSAAVLVILALLFCCSARNTAHVSDLYPAFSNSSVLVAFPTLLLFQKFPSPASDWPSSSWAQARGQTFHRDDSRCVHLLFPYLRRVLDSDEITCYNLVAQELILFLSLVAWIAHEEGQGHMQPLISKALPTGYVSTHELRVFLVSWIAE